VVAGGIQEPTSSSQDPVWIVGCNQLCNYQCHFYMADQVVMTEGTCEDLILLLMEPAVDAN
jgi:hypothetical protein